jgi:hypothetical protein
MKKEKRRLSDFLKETKERRRHLFLHLSNVVKWVIAGCGCKVGSGPGGSNMDGGCGKVIEFPGEVSTYYILSLQHIGT